jgi:hypothetical protein
MGRILKILKITGLTEVFGIYATVDQAIAATKGRPGRNASPGARRLRVAGLSAAGTVTPPE